MDSDQRTDKIKREFSRKIRGLSNSPAYLDACEEVCGYRLPLFNMMDKEQIDYLLNAVPISSGDTVLDLGCGDGSLLRLLAAKYGCKAFSLLCGFTAGEYIRNHRLASAGNELLSTNENIITIAMKYGYDSPDSFTKAFTRFHGYTPTAVRKSGKTIKTVVLLPNKLNAGERSTVDFDMSELDVTAPKAKPRKDETEAYVRQKNGLKVSSLYISQVKRKLGLEVGESFNQPKSENAKVPQCPPEKEKAITDALEHFKMLPQRENKNETNAILCV